MQKPNTLNLRRNGSIVATVSPSWDGECFRFRVELFGAFEGVTVTLKKLSDAIEWAELSTSDLAAKKDEILLDC